MMRMAHSMIRVRDEARSCRFYETAFGLSVADRLDFEGFTLIYLRSDACQFELELTINKDQSLPYDLGTGYGHLAFVVDGLAEAHEELTREGLAPTPIKELQLRGTTIARFFFVTDPDGYRIEVIDRLGRFN
jgi:lactoylglutathione lyase